MNLSSRMLALAMTIQAAAAWAVPAGVLCVSGGGHVALEDLGADCCHPEEHADAARAPSIAVSADEDCCGPCTDVELVTAPPAKSSGEPDGVAAPVLTAVWSAPPTARPAPASLRGRSPSPPSPPPALAGLRTVVLTC